MFVTYRFSYMFHSSCFISTLPYSSILHLHSSFPSVTIIYEKLDRVIHLFVLGGLKLNKLDLKQYTTYSHTGIHSTIVCVGVVTWILSLFIHKLTLSWQQKNVNSSPTPVFEKDRSKKRHPLWVQNLICSLLFFGNVIFSEKFTMKLFLPVQFVVVMSFHESTESVAVCDSTQTCIPLTDCPEINNKVSDQTAFQKNLMVSPLCYMYLKIYFIYFCSLDNT